MPKAWIGTQFPPRTLPPVEPKVAERKNIYHFTFYLWNDRGAAQIDRPVVPWGKTVIRNRKDI